MIKHRKLVVLAARVKLATTPLERMRALYDLRNFLNNVDPLELFISVDTSLTELEGRLSDADKDVMRVRGYQFPEDFDEPRKMFCKE